MSTDAAAPTQSTPTPGGVEGPKQVKVNSGLPVHYFVQIASQSLKEGSPVELSGLGFATTAVVNVAEILKTNKEGVVKAIATSVAEMQAGNWSVRKPRIQITIEPIAVQ
eukprot:CAMPEP_0177657434 /NCGR_PEP_ID=MMETSP0447-20121125/16180_1 /TAXON_ID=0 /ORGANISM="Stygamoeba regulata, Strain BSH-02190019" /LENGTH=108 /DNA_ID=CAMNT_0019161783 /DNA_START=85 /DNA_END=411 /DNA_ORIENTATION=+